MPRLWHNGTPRITCDHLCHLRRGSLGGEDFGLDVGTPLFAPFDGTFRFHNNGTGGWTVTGIPADARIKALVAQVLHLSAANGLILGGASRYYSEGALVAFSGGAWGHPGAGQSTGPHSHEHGIWNGVRLGIRDAIAKARAILTPVIVPAAPPPSTEDPDEENEMKSIQLHYTNAEGGVVRAIWTPGTSFFLRWTGNSPTIANAFSAAGMGASVEVTESLYNAIERECDDMKAKPAVADPALGAAIADIRATLDGIAAAITGGAR